VKILQATDKSAEVLKQNQKKGLVFVYTGNGKGKTTAAFGLALRAIGHGRKVLILQFMKGREYGETAAVKKYLPNLKVEQFGQDTFVTKDNPSPLDIELANKGLAIARKAILSDDYDLIILDEINVAIDFELIPMEEVLNLIKIKPERLTLGLTGRYASQEIIDHADLVTEMKEIKHPYTKGVTSKEGFEF